MKIEEQKEMMLFGVSRVALFFCYLLLKLADISAHCICRYTN